MINEIQNVSGKTVDRIEVVRDKDGQLINIFFADRTVVALILKNESKINVLEYTPENDAHPGIRTDHCLAATGSANSGQSVRDF